MYLYDNCDAEEVKKLILSKKYFRNQGENVETHCTKFEKDFSKFMGAPHSLLVTSGTNALICALTALGLKPNDEVLIPAYTFFATAAAVVNAGGKPKIINIDEYLSIDIAEIEIAITKNTKAIIAVHMDGRPCDMNSILNLCKKYSLALIEDVAQAVGGTYKNQKLGSIGDYGCYSFNVDKIISCGEGGAVITKTRKNFEKILSAHDGCCSFGPTFKNSFTEIKPSIGFSMRASEIQGLMIHQQLKKVDSIISTLKQRQNILKSILPTINSHDPAGECGTSIFLKFNSVDDCQKKLIELQREKIKAIAINMRPAHSVWQWIKTLQERFGPAEYKISDYLKTIDVLTTVLKIDTQFDLDLKNTENFADQILGIIKN